MKMINTINERLEEIRAQVMKLVENESLSLTQKNQQMQPLVEEKKVLEHTLVYLERIKNTDYQGLCNPTPRI
jgi:flagellar biosynthesis/type III secretory pathway chaperone